MSIIVGYIITFGCVFGVFIAHGGNMKVLLEALPFEMITIWRSRAGARSS
jgi:chemotaxis protein MotA